MIGGSGEKKTLRTIAKYADMWNGMGRRRPMRHKVDGAAAALRAVGRDLSEIEFTLGAKPIIRDSEAEARAVWKASMAYNQTPMCDVEDDSTFWPGTPEQIAERLSASRPLGFNNGDREMPAPCDQRRWSASSAR